MVPFVVTNYNAVELGPRGTGKSHLFQQVSPYAHLVSGGKATIANMFVNNATGRRGLVAQYDVDLLRRGVRRVLRHEGRRQHPQGLHGVRASSAAARRASAPRAASSWSATSTSTSRSSSARATSSVRCRRRCATTRPSTTASTPTCQAGTFPSSTRPTSPSHFGFVSDFLAECWSQLRRTSRLEVTQGRLEWGGQLSGRDRKAANNTVNGLLKLLWPNPDMEVPDEALAWAAELALELRRRVKEQQAFIGAAEFGKVDLSYRVGGRAEKVVYCEETLRHRLRAADEPLPAMSGRRQRRAPEPDPRRSSRRSAPGRPTTPSAT